MLFETICYNNNVLFGSVFGVKTFNHLHVSMCEVGFIISPSQSPTPSEDYTTSPSLDIAWWWWNEIRHLSTGKRYVYGTHCTEWLPSSDNQLRQHTYISVSYNPFNISLEIRANKLGALYMMERQINSYSRLTQSTEAGFPTKRNRSLNNFRLNFQ